jgi:predicted transposase/invertase (TIGR01784 family)
MKKDIKDINLDYKFNLINMKDIDCEKLIKLDNPDALVLAILCNFKDKNKLETIMQMLEKLANYTKDDEKAYSNYLLAMETLTENMKVHKILQEAEKMLRTMTMEKSISYQIGIQRGIENGAKQKQIEIAKVSLKQGLDINTIFLITGLSIKEIQNLKKY